MSFGHLTLFRFVEIESNVDYDVQIALIHRGWRGRGFSWKNRCFLITWYQKRESPLVEEMNIDVSQVAIL